MANHTTRLLAVVALAGLAAAAGCRGDRTTKRPHQFFPDLDDQPKLKAQGQSMFFADGRSMRPPVPGTVAFGNHAEMSWRDPAAEAYSLERIENDRADILRDDPAIYLGIGPDGEYVKTIPIPVTPELMQLGAKKYNIYCIACHGVAGNGKGAVGLQWSYPLPDFHAPQYQPGGEKGADGYIFHVIRNGVANAPGQLPALKMPSYAQQVGEREAWGVVAYFRALQNARKASIANVPPAERQELERSRGANPAAAPAGQENAQ